MGYPAGLLKTRAVIRPGEYAIIPPEGRVKNVIPGFEKCDITIIASPKLGASFVQYIVTVQPGGGTTTPFATDPELESFIYLMDDLGSIDVTFGEDEKKIVPGGYVFAGPDCGLYFTNKGDKSVRVLLYKQRYVAYDGEKPASVVGNVNDIEELIYDDMENVFIKDLLPTDIRFDMNMHILSFEPTGSHPFVETHVQEHGAYVLEGEGLYLLGEEWLQVQQEDFIFFGPYTPQAVYATGRGRLTYIYSKDCNRDVEI